MTRTLTTVPPSLTIDRAAGLMREKRIRRLPVVESIADGPRLLGIVSASDLYRAFPPDVNPFSPAAEALPSSEVVVADIMLRNPATTTGDAPVEQAAQVMRDRKIGALPVVRREILVGIITESDIFRAFVAMLEPCRGGIRVTFDISESEDIFTTIGLLTAKRTARVAALLTTHHEGKRLCVAHLVGGAIDRLVEDLWASGHKVMSVLRL